MYFRLERSGDNEGLSIGSSSSGDDGSIGFGSSQMVVDVSWIGFFRNFFFFKNILSCFFTKLNRRAAEPILFNFFFFVETFEAMFSWQNRVSFRYWEAIWPLKRATGEQIAIGSNDGKSFSFRSTIEKGCVDRNGFNDEPWPKRRWIHRFLI